MRIHTHNTKSKNIHICVCENVKIPSDFFCQELFFCAYVYTYMSICFLHVCRCLKKSEGALILLGLELQIAGSFLIYWKPNKCRKYSQLSLKPPFSGSSGFLSDWEVSIFNNTVYSFLCLSQPRLSTACMGSPGVQ